MPPPDWSAVRALFDRLAELAPAARAEALAAAPAPLRAEVQALLDQHDAEEAAGGAFLARPAAWAPAPAAPPPDRRGERLGPWRLVAPLGAGGMGEVWEARRDDGAYDARVAVKLLPADAGAGSRREDAVLHETRALARLNHPHIARLLDAGRNAEGRPYFVMEAVDGRPIDEACRGLPLAARLQCLLQLADAVAHAHGQGLVHRDLKPANVLVDAAGQVKLLDFGIATALDAAAEGPGAPRAITPGYASPEQLRGEPVTAQTDVWALGVLLYRVLTGVRPFAPGSDATPTAQALMRATLEDEPTRPSRAPVDAAGDPGVPRRQLRGDLDAIVAKALARPLGERYGRVQALADDLRAWLALRPVSARPRTAAYVAWRFVQRQRVAVAAGAVALGAVLAALATAALQAREAVAALALAVMAAAVALSTWQARRAARARDEARARLAETGRLVRDVLMRYADMATFLPGGLRMKADLLTDAIAHLERLHGLAPEDAELAAELAKAHARLADLQLPGLDTSLEQGDECRVHAARALALFPRGEAAQATRPDFFQWWARALRCQAKLERLAGETEASLATQQRLSRFLHGACQRFPEQFDLRFEQASALVGLAMALDTWFEPSLGRSEQALAVLAEAREAYEALAARQPGNGDVHFQLGTIAGARMIVLQRLGRAEEALQAGREAVQQRADAMALQPENVGYREGLAGESSNFTTHLLQAGCIDEALAVSARGEAVIEALEREDPSVPTWTQRRRWFAMHRGRALRLAGQAAEALPRLREALLAMADAEAGWVLGRRGWCRLELALAESALGEHAAARASAGQAVADLQRLLAATPGDADAARRLQQAQALLGAPLPPEARGV